MEPKHNKGHCTIYVLLGLSVAWENDFYIEDSVSLFWQEDVKIYVALTLQKCCVSDSPKVMYSWKIQYGCSIESEDLPILGQKIEA